MELILVSVWQSIVKPSGFLLKRYTELLGWYQGKLSLDDARKKTWLFDTHVSFSTVYPAFLSSTENLSGKLKELLIVIHGEDRFCLNDRCAEVSLSLLFHGLVIASFVRILCCEFSGVSHQVTQGRYDGIQASIRSRTWASERFGGGHKGDFRFLLHFPRHNWPADYKCKFIEDWSITLPMVIW